MSEKWHPKGMLHDHADYFRKRFETLKIDLLSIVAAVDISPAAHHWLCATDQETWRPDIDFHCIVSPWEWAWYEFTLPAFTLSKGSRLPLDTNGRVGHLVHTIEIPEESRREALQTDQLLRTMLGSSTLVDPSGLPERKRALKEALALGRFPRWIMEIILFTDYRRHDMTVGSLYGLYLDEQGRTISGLQTSSTPRTSPLEDLLFDPQQLADIVNAGIIPLLFALSLMHCKNVETIQSAPVPPKVAKARAKSGVPDIRYRTIVVHPVARRSVSDNGKGGKHTLRGVRGHFKHFEQGKGLFGKWHGTYWWGDWRVADIETREYGVAET
jgi:hypothetical protein